MSTKRFGELTIGTRFSFRARRYEKVAPEIGRDEERGGNVFHAHTEVVVEASLAGGHHAGGGVPNGAARRRPDAPVCPPYRSARYVRRGRLGREPGRELRPYGTL